MLLSQARVRSESTSEEAQGNEGVEVEDEYESSQEEGEMDDEEVFSKTEEVTPGPTPQKRNSSMSEYNTFCWNVRGFNKAVRRRKILAKAEQRTFWKPH